LDVLDFHPDLETPRRHIVDADLHGHEDLGQIAEYLSNPWSVSMERLANGPQKATVMAGLSPKAEYTLPFPGGLNRKKVTTRPQEMVSQIDALGITTGVIFPDYLLRLPMVERPDFAVAVAAAYNSWLSDRWLQGVPRLKGAIVVAPQDPVRAAEEVRRHASNPAFVAVCAPICGLRTLLGHMSYDPIFQAAAEADLPIVLHSVTTVYTTFPFQLDVFESQLMRHAFGHALSTLVNVASMIETGVQERFPSLRIGALEAGLAWLLFAMKRLDRGYLERRREVPALRELPSTYLRRMYFGTQPLDVTTASSFRSLEEACGGDLRLMYASDWPHHDFDHPRAIQKLGLSEPHLQRIFADNALELFRKG
jgi:predicted TIM-barrel fold metal-dependent hydrolase